MFQHYSSVTRVTQRYLSRLQKSHCNTAYFITVAFLLFVGGKSMLVPELFIAWDDTETWLGIHDIKQNFVLNKRNLKWHLRFLTPRIPALIFFC